MEATFTLAGLPIRAGVTVIWAIENPHRGGLRCRPDDTRIRRHGFCSSVTDYPETAPAITSFTASATSVSAGTPVTLSCTVTGTTTRQRQRVHRSAYAYIDNLGRSGSTPCRAAAV